MDNERISHKDPSTVETIVTALQDQYRKETPLVVHWGKTHDYRGMEIDYTIPEKVCFNMDQYILNLINECSAELMKGSSMYPSC